MLKFMRAYIKSMRLYYAFVTGIAGWLGIAFFNIEGGEPFFAYERLKQICEAIDSKSEI